MHNIYTLFLVERELIQFSVDCIKTFFKWLRTSCVVYITTILTWICQKQLSGPKLAGIMAMRAPPKFWDPALLISALLNLVTVNPA